MIQAQEWFRLTHFPTLEQIKAALCDVAVSGEGESLLSYSPSMPFGCEPIPIGDGGQGNLTEFEVFPHFLWRLGNGLPHYRMFGRAVVPIHEGGISASTQTVELRSAPTVCCGKVRFHYYALDVQPPTFDPIVGKERRLFLLQKPTLHELETLYSVQRAAPPEASTDSPPPLPPPSLSCPECGALMVQAGGCYRCMSCGSTQGCS